MRSGSRRTLADVGEFDLIHRIEAMIAREAAAGGTPIRAPQLRVGIGDDAAVLRLRSSMELVISNDAFVEGTHFRWETRAAPSLGRCALAASLSDLAAMGARPLGFTCAFAAPSSLTLARFDGMFRGIVSGAARWQSPLIGGNVTRARETSLALTVFGEVRRGRALLRSGLRIGDRLFVTGTLGGSALDLARSRSGVRLRHGPEPRLAPGRALARMRERGACIDVSDGLVADLGQLLAASGDLGAEVDVASLPRRAGFARACARAGLEPDRLVLGGGEDYELLFSLRRGAPAPAVLSRRMGVMVTEIGRITRRPGIHGVPPELLGGGWKHF